MTAIDEKYEQLGGIESILGQPVAPERATPDGRGRFRHYEYGSIYATLTTGAHEMHGAILAKWEDLGWEGGLLGYPITDELPTRNKRGQFNQFEHGSIYWTPELGAHEVHGDIRAKWKELGWEESFLGFPTSDELDTPDGRGRYSMFEGGAIYWYPDSGTQVRSNLPAVENCSISGRAYGASVGFAPEFTLFLLGPNDRSLDRASTRFDAQLNYRFSGLSSGVYWIALDAGKKGDWPIVVTPPMPEIACSGNVIGIDFEFK